MVYQRGERSNRCCVECLKLLEIAHTNKQRKKDGMKKENSWTKHNREVKEEEEE